jgi:uncharacterized membrane protein YGL010W
MKSLIDHLGQYAAYHRDRRNIATHFVGIPLIVLAVAVLLSRPGLSTLGLWWSPASLTAIAATGFYLRLDLRFGLLMAALLGLCLWAGALLAVQSTGTWLSWGLGLFVLGWMIQFVGHYYEGRKPAFVDDLMGLAVGPLFVVAELGFLLGCRDEVREAVEQRAGPSGIRQR